MIAARLGWFARKIPLFARLRGYRWTDLRADAKAGLNVALLDFPQGMAYALIGGLPVQAGIYASAIGSVSGPLFASSRFLMVGPTNASAVLLLSALAPLGLPDDQRVLVLPLLLLMVGAIFLIGAALNAGIVVKYISRSVITGYVTAGACLIVVNQLKHVFGLDIPREATLWSTLASTLRHLGEMQPATLLVGVFTFALYQVLRRFARGLPAVAITLVVVTAVASGLSRFAHVPLPNLDPIPLASWPLSLPVFNADLFSRLASPALALAFLCLLESASIAKTLAARSGDTVDIRQQMISMGFANAANAFGSGMPVSGSLTRSVLNWSSGARTPVSSMISGAILVTGVLVLGPLIGHIPRAALAALVIAVGVSLIDRNTIRLMLQSTRADAATFGTTLVGGLLFPLDTAIFFGVVTSLLFFLHKVAQPRLTEYAFTGQGDLAESSADGTRPTPAVSIVHVEGDLFFGSADVFLEQMRLLVQAEHLKVVILRVINAHTLDATSALAVGELVRFARERGRQVILSGLQPEAEGVFRRTGLWNLVGDENIFRHTPENVTLATRHALKRAQAIMGAEKAEIILFARPKTKEA